MNSKFDKLETVWGYNDLKSEMNRMKQTYEMNSKFEK